MVIDRIQLSSFLIVLTFASVFLLSSQSASSYSTYLLAIVMLGFVSQWRDIFLLRGAMILMVLVVYLVTSGLWSEPFDWSDFFSTLVRGLLVFLFVAALAESEQRGLVQRWLASALALVGTIVAGAALIDFFVNPPPVVNRLNGFGQLDNHNVAALMFSVVFIMQLKVLTSKNVGVVIRLFSLIGCGVLLATIYFSDSRNAWGSVALGSCVYLMAMFIRDKGRFLATLAAGLVISIALILVFISNPNTRDNLIPRGDSYRIEIWEISLQRLAESNPVFGLGINTPDDVQVKDTRIFNHPHSMYISTLVQGGIIGFVLLLLLVAEVLSRAYLSYEDPSVKLAFGLIAVGLGSFLFDGHELVDKVGESWFLFWLPVGLLLGVEWRRTYSSEDLYAS